ncbi:MAG TPA: DUF4178 domain-containing protein [Desulfotignum sp.]|nr:DUF4178 domain-containing protein [Desulfotignum sp.]
MLDAAAHKSFQERFATIRTLKKSCLVPPKDALALSIRDAGPHWFFDYMGSTFFVKDLARYEETSDDFKNKTGDSIYELTCLNLDTGRTVNFEWEYDDALEVAMTLDRLSFRDLTDDAGAPVDGDDLDQIADDSDAILLNNEKFWYEDDWAALYYRGEKAEKVYMYEFENEDHTRFITIEEWSGSGREEYRIYTSCPVEPDQIQIIARGES